MLLESFLTLVNIHGIVPFRFNIFRRFLNETILYRFSGLIKCCARGSTEREETLLHAHSHSHSASSNHRPSINYHHSDVEILENGNNNVTKTKNESKGFMDGLEKVKTIAWLLTLGDGMHNFLGEYYCHPMVWTFEFLFRRLGNWNSLYAIDRSWNYNFSCHCM